jgi:hypothetical protein
MSSADSPIAQRRTMADRGSHSGRERADAALAAALVGGATYDQAAEVAGVSVRTVSRRLSDPEFLRCLSALRAEIFEAVANRLTHAGLLALTTLVELLARESPPSVRLGAARALLDSMLRHADTIELEQRLRALETEGT